VTGSPSQRPASAGSKTIKPASSWRPRAGGVSTGERGDRILLDDPHNVIKAESDLEREKTVRFVRESMSNRLNDAGPAEGRHLQA
jgi:hypothetical protein